MAQKPKQWNLDTDVLVVGSGAAGLPAAISAHDNGARVVVIEKSDLVGGTTACSGGGMWIPNNHHNVERGVIDSRENALTYAKLLTKGRAADELIETYIDTAPEMLRYMEENAGLRVDVSIMPDYHPETPGGMDGKNSRSLIPDIFDTNELGENKGKLRPNPTQPLPMKNSELIAWKAIAMPQRIDWNLMAKRMEEGFVGFGTALVGFMYKACLDRKIEVILNTRALELVMEEGQVIGLLAQKDGKDMYIRADKGVILACGGFEWNEQLKKAFLPGPITHMNSVPHNEGDGLKMAIAVGADLANMSECWGWASAEVPGEEYAGRPLSRGILTERNVPHSIMVNRKGRRFVNEAANYNSMFKNLWFVDENTMESLNQPCWIIADQQFKDKYALATIMPGDDAPPWLDHAQSLKELAEKVGIDPQGLEETVEKWNRYVADNYDPDFHRGLSVYDSLWGDPEQKPNPAMGTIEKPPFYALPIYCGSLGTKGGPRTNTNAQVINIFGQVIEGLYAAGNVMASVCGPAYWGGGSTIAPAMTFGYISGRHAAKR